MFKLFITLALIMGGSFAVAAPSVDDLDYRSLDNTNYMPLANACGSHFIVNGTDLLAIIIVNDHATASLPDGAICAYSQGCDGRVVTLHCNGSTCESDLGAKLTVLKNDKILTVNSENQTFVSDRSPTSKYKICP